MVTTMPGRGVSVDERCEEWRAHMAAPCQQYIPVVNYGATLPTATSTRHSADRRTAARSNGHKGADEHEVVA